MASRDWAGLPDVVLFSILRCLSSLEDLFSFAGVCRAWRSFLRSAIARLYLSSRPPLLLSPPRPRPPRRPFRTFLVQLTSPPAPAAADFRLHALDRPPTSFLSLLPGETLAASCLGYSHGYLLLLLRHRREALLADVLTGAEIRPPTLPPDRHTYLYASLTAPPSSPDCRILLFYSKYALMCCRLGDPHLGWTQHRLEPGVSYITRVLSFKGRIFAVDSRAKLLAFDFVPEFRVEVLKVRELRPMPDYDRWQFGPQLVDCGGELLLVLFVEERSSQMITRIDVYRLDFGRMVWVEVESLGDFSLFIDCGGKSPVSCANPGSWGGSSNCIYLAGPDCNGWMQYSLDGKTWREYSPDDGRLMYSGLLPPSINHTQPAPRWPSPIWVYPSLFFGS